MALSTVSVILIEPVAVFEFGVAVEVFGLDRADDGVPPFDFRVCSVTPGVALETKNASPFTITASYGLDAVVGSDLVIVAATLVRDPTDYPAEVLQVLRDAHAAGATLLSLCSGSFVLGAAGLLDDRDCTTHWKYVDDMRAAYPLAKVDPRALFVDDGTVVTSAGTAAGIDACLHLVRRELGTAVANKIARRMVVPPQRDGGQQQFVEMPIPECTADSLAPVLNWVLSNLAEPHSASSLAKHADDERPHVRPAIRRGNGHHPAQVVDPAAHPRGPRPAGGVRPWGRADRDPGRLQLGRGDAGALPPGDRPRPGRLSPSFRLPVVVAARG